MARAGRAMGLSRSAAFLTAGGMVEFALQFLLPVILVRQLDADTFGQYRFLTLMLGTALAMAPAFMPQALYYFLPRAGGRQLTVIGNALAYLACMGLAVALLASPASPLAGNLSRALHGATHGLSALYLGLSVLLTITTTLAIAEGRILWHCSTELALALLRTALVALAAILSHDIAWVLAALVLDAALRLAVLAAYFLTRPGGARLRCAPASLLAQLRYALPFAAGGSLFAMRAQADGWIAASLLPTHVFAAFTIGAVVLPVASLIRQPINSAMLPHLNRAFAGGARAEVHALLLKGSGAATLLLAPLAGALFLLAPEIVALVYTERYLAAVPVMRLYLLLVALQSVAVGFAMPALDMGRLALRINLAGLALSAALSLAGVHWFGLAGAALGSVAAFLLCELANARAVGKVLGRPWRTMFPLRLAGLVLGACVTAILLAEWCAPAFGAGPWRSLGGKLGVYAAAALTLFAACGGLGELRRLCAPFAVPGVAPAAARPPSA
ncbi:lipopolysaccharide biosynthesis protein [Massilia timonae]|uniref:lipopolysaccharide biosynthesis protein n=1 Tax=Massilia timonae TaxID=47229 RepID=UPI0028D033A5|nr:polysaccharide biosynthesis C-terminal domain-containing protein [Massilia timonae]